MKIKIEEGKDKIDVDGDGIDDRLKPEFSEFELDSMQSSRATVKMLVHILDELKVLNHQMTPARDLGKSAIEKATAQLAVAENQKPWDKEPIPNPKGRSSIRPQDAKSVFKSSEKTYSLAWNHIRLPWGADLKWTMNLKKNTEQNSTMLVIPRDGIDDSTGKPYSPSETVKVKMSSVKVDPEGRFMDIPIWHYAVKGKVALNNGDIVDTEGLTIATREEQVRLSRAYLKWPKVPQYRRENLEIIEDVLVEVLMGIEDEDKSS